jgi:hypothetical protein
VLLEEFWRHRSLHPARDRTATDRSPDGLNAWSSSRLVRPQDLVHVLAPAEEFGQSDGVFYRHGRTLGQQGRERVRRVTGEEHAGSVIRRCSDLLDRHEDYASRVLLLLVSDETLPWKRAASSFKRAKRPSRDNVGTSALCASRKA